MNFSVKIFPNVLDLGQGDHNVSTKDFFHNWMASLSIRYVLKENKDFVELEKI